MYKRKTQDEFILLADYGQGFEEVVAESSRIEIRQRLKEYQQNDSYAHRFKIIKKRIKIEQPLKALENVKDWN